MIEKPKKKKRAELDESIFVERQRKSVELMRSQAALPITEKSSEFLELKELIKKMDSRIRAQDQRIQDQDDRIDEQDQIIEELHFLVTLQAAQIETLSHD